MHILDEILEQKKKWLLGKNKKKEWNMGFSQ